MVLVLKKRKVVLFGLTVEIEPSAPGDAAPTGTVAFELVTKKEKEDRHESTGDCRVKRWCCSYNGPRQERAG